MKVQTSRDFGKRECPSCAVEVDANNNRCPICGYEFPNRSQRQKTAIVVVALLMVALFLWLVL